MVQVRTRNPLNILSYRCRWWFSLGVLFFVLSAFFLKSLIEYNFEAEAYTELRQLFSERQTQIKDFLQRNQKMVQDLLDLPEFKMNIEKLDKVEGVEKDKLAEEMRGLFKYHQRGVPYNDAFILSSKGERLFEFGKKSFVSFDPLKEGSDMLQSAKQQALQQALNVFA